MAKKRLKRREKGYRIVTMALYTPEIDWTDEMSSKLQRSGIVKASRSLVIREAIRQLQDELAGKSDESILRFFLERQARRARAVP